MTLLERAVVFAAEKHSGMLRKIDGARYILHPMEATLIISGMSDDEELLAAAMLHDVVEDTNTSMEEIRVLFGPRVAELVASETENKRRGIPKAASWRIRKEESLAELAASDDRAVKMLWLGDKLSNMRALYKKWSVVGGEVWSFFNQHDPDQHAWYYRSIAELLSELKEYEAWQEYDRLVRTVFEEVTEE